MVKETYSRIIVLWYYESVTLDNTMYFWFNILSDKTTGRLSSSRPIGQTAPVETYSRIGLVRRYGNLQSYWTSTKLWKLTVVLDYYEAMETYSRIGLVRSYGNLQSYWTSTKLWELTVVLDYYEAMETYYSRIGLVRSYGNLQSYCTIPFLYPVSSSLTISSAKRILYCFRPNGLRPRSLT